MTVVETEEFPPKAKPLMSETVREELVAFLGAYPEAGKIVAETGGVRKVRWGLAGRGKRGGARMICYYHSERLSKEREGESHPGRAQCHEAVGADPGGGVSGEEVGGRDEHEDQGQATGEEDGGRVPMKRSTVGASIIKGLEQAIAWTRGENDNVRVALVHVPEVDVREVRTKMGLSQAQFATKFGFPATTLRNYCAELGTGPGAPGCADPGAARGDR